jgi:hypothetical protein
MKSSEPWLEEVYLIPLMGHQTPSENRDRRQTLSAHSLRPRVCRSDPAGRFRLTLFVLGLSLRFLDSDSCLNGLV